MGKNEKDKGIISNENIEKEKKEKSIYERCLNKLLQHCYSINDETLQSCLDYIVQFIKHSSSIEIDSYITKIIGTINYQFTFPQDLFLRDIFQENQLNKEMIFSLICPNFNVKNITKYPSFKTIFDVEIEANQANNVDFEMEYQKLVCYILNENVLLLEKLKKKLK